MLYDFDRVKKDPLQVKRKAEQEEHLLKRKEKIEFGNVEPKESSLQPVVSTKEIPLSDSDPSKVTRIGTRMEPAFEVDLIQFLSDNRDVFA